MVEKSGEEITRDTPGKIVEQFSGLVESNIIGVDTNLEIIMPNILKFRNNHKKLENFESKYKNVIGNIKRGECRWCHKQKVPIGTLMAPKNIRKDLKYNN